MDLHELRFVPLHGLLHRRAASLLAASECRVRVVGLVSPSAALESDLQGLVKTPVSFNACRRRNVSDEGATGDLLRVLDRGVGRGRAALLQNEKIHAGRSNLRQLLAGDSNVRDQSLDDRLHSPVFHVRAQRRRADRLEAEEHLDGPSDWTREVAKEFVLVEVVQLAVSVEVEVHDSLLERGVDQRRVHVLRAALRPAVVRAGLRVPVRNQGRQNCSDAGIASD